MHTSAFIVTFTDSQPYQWLSTKLTVNHYDAPILCIVLLLFININILSGPETEGERGDSVVV